MKLNKFMQINHWFALIAYWSHAQNDLGIICNIYNLLLWLNHPNIPHVCVCLGLFVYAHTLMSVRVWVFYGFHFESILASRLS